MGTERAGGIADLFQEVLKTLEHKAYLRNWENRNILIEQSTTLIKHSSLKLIFYKLYMQLILHSYLYTATLTIVPNIL